MKPNKTQQRDINFLNHANMLAELYEITIDWEKSDIDKRILHFDCDDEEKILKWSLKMSEVFDNIIE